MKRVLSFHVERWALPQPSHIAGRTFEEVDGVPADLAEDGNVGRGEALDICFTDDQLPTVVSQRKSVRAKTQGGFNRQSEQVTVDPDFCWGTGASTT